MKHLYIKQLLLCLCLLAGTTTTKAIIIDNIIYKLSGDEAIVTYSSWSNNENAYAGDVVIPPTITYNGKTYIVTSIDIRAFHDCSGLTSVSIPNSVTTIGQSAFSYCRGLTSVTIGSGVSNIENATFQNCSALNTITIPGNVKNIGDNAFSSSGLTSITISEGVISIGDAVFSGSKSLTSITIPNSVTSIGDYAFSACSKLASISIGSGLTSIGSGAFNGCTALTKVIISDIAAWCNISFYSLPHNLAKHLYLENEENEITELIIPEGVTNIGNSAFKGCSSLTSVTIPNSVTSIGNDAFRNCSGLTSVTIGNSVTSIGDYAFNGCSSPKKIILSDIAAWCNVTLGNSDSSPLSYAGHLYLENDENEVKDLVIPDGVTSISDYAFNGCNFLTSITIPDGMRSIGKNALPSLPKLYVNRGTDGMLALWNYGGREPNETGTQHRLFRPSITSISSTQATTTFKVNHIYPELQYSLDNAEPIGNNQYIIRELRPECTHTINLIVHSAHNSFSTSTTATTLPISPEITNNGVTASSISVKGSYTEGDATVVSQSFMVNNVETGWAGGTLLSLEPDSTYSFKYRVAVEYGGGNIYFYEYLKEIKTSELILTTQQPKVISEGSVIVSAVSNLDDEETNVGFEWRRIDWTDDFDSKSGGAYLYGGTMEGYIRSINSNYLWKFRPYYTSAAGNRYYGEWKGMDPSDYSWFEPTVHTYAQISVQGNMAEVKGYAMRGTDKVTSQGFMYWPNNTSFSLRRKAASIPDDVTVVKATGNVMTATLEDLEYETTYNYVAFVTTSEDETFFGEVQTFKTDGDPDGIEEIKNESLTPSLSKGEGVWYSLDGRKLDKPQKGLNIIRYSDGTSRKVLVK